MFLELTPERDKHHYGRDSNRTININIYNCKFLHDFDSNSLSYKRETKLLALLPVTPDSGKSKNIYQA
jgi:hypothetical protein